MTKLKLSQLAVLARKRRGAHKLRETAQDIGIGPATLMRIEAGRIPDVQTFGKVCKWLAIDPGNFLGFSKTAEPDDAEPLTVSAHLRADKTPRQETVQALAQMIFFVAKRQPNSTEPGDG